MKHLPLGLFCLTANRAVIVAASVRHETRLLVSVQCIIFYNIQFNLYSYHIHLKKEFQRASFGLKSHVIRKNLSVSWTSSFCWWNWKYHILNFFFMSFSYRGLLLSILSVTCSTSKNRLHGFTSGERGGHNPVFMVLSPKNTLWTTSRVMICRTVLITRQAVCV